MTKEKIKKLANICYYDFDMSEGENNCSDCPRYYTCREVISDSW